MTAPGTVTSRFHAPELMGGGPPTLVHDASVGCPRLHTAPKRRRVTPLQVQVYSLTRCPDCWTEARWRQALDTTRSATS